MRLATLFGPDFRQTLESEPEAIREALEEFHEEDIAEICEDLDIADVVALMHVLPDEFAAGVLERMESDRQTWCRADGQPGGASARGDAPTIAPTWCRPLAPAARVLLVELDNRARGRTTFVTSAYDRRGRLDLTRLRGRGSCDEGWQAMADSAPQQRGQAEDYSCTACRTASDCRRLVAT